MTIIKTTVQISMHDILISEVEVFGELWMKVFKL